MKWTYYNEALETHWLHRFGCEIFAFIVFSCQMAWQSEERTEGKGI